MKISKELNQSYQKFDKNGLRKRVLNNNFRSNQIGSDECIANCINFLESINFQSIALYSATKYEISVNKIFFHLLNKSKQIFFPKINGDKLNFYLVNDLNELKISKKETGLNTQERSIISQALSNIIDKLDDPLGKKRGSIK